VIKHDGQYYHKWIKVKQHCFNIHKNKGRGRTDRPPRSHWQRLWGDHSTESSFTLWSNDCVCGIQGMCRLMIVQPRSLLNWKLSSQNLVLYGSVLNLWELNVYLFLVIFFNSTAARLTSSVILLTSCETLFISSVILYNTLRSFCNRITFFCNIPRLFYYIPFAVPQLMQHLPQDIALFTRHMLVIEISNLLVQFLRLDPLFISWENSSWKLFFELHYTNSQAIQSD
jgi:hypothetical protein